MTSQPSTIHTILSNLPRKRLDALKQLFWSELNYDRANNPLSTRNWPEELNQMISEPPLLFASAGDQASFRIIYIRLRSTRPLITNERQIINQLIDEHPFALFIFSNQDQRYWHFVNVKYDHVQEAKSRRLFRRITISPEERLRTAAERISLLNAVAAGRDLFGVSPLAIQKIHDEAFDVEKVTKKFFDEYKKLFFVFMDELYKHTKDKQWAHDFALQFLNRLMFLYYIQRKRWLADNPNFLAELWRSYSPINNQNDTFVSEWLHVLFFESFNVSVEYRKATRPYFPNWVNNALNSAPYLNGGLFSQNLLDRQYKVKITDDQFREIFQFFESYNFTITEDTPLDQEVAVDPEMIGKVYESLVYVSEEADERGEAGIFYTPRVEIDLMCRLALVDWFTNHLGLEYKHLLYEFIFAFEPEQKRQVDEKIRNSNLWSLLSEMLHSVKILDPSCGSGSFLVGMLFVMDDLICRANEELGIQESEYERKKRIIANSLYGVDVMKWAVHVAELRLWLQLVIETDMLNPAELHYRPLLPNLSFKIRPGDSLVQEIGGINFAMRKGSTQIPNELKGEIKALQGEKIKYYNNEKSRKFLTEDELRAMERKLFQDILLSRIGKLQEHIKEIDQSLKPAKNLFGEIQSTQMGLERISKEQDRERSLVELEQARRAYEVIRVARDIPFVWDIAFVEVFDGESGGFDIVIGNPPYVRQEMIHDPKQSPDLVTNNSKKEYKTKLAKAVYHAWPLTFGYNFDKDSVTWNLDAKSDLYIYFYFYCLSLLSQKGILCFITSNSWLNVGYGSDLQEFLLTRGKVLLIIDNQVKRSFANAEVNTVIVLLSSTGDSKKPIIDRLEHLAKFMTITVPFENTLDPIIWIEVDETDIRRTTKEYRVFPVKQLSMYKSRIDTSRGKYVGDKWGGKYLRSPDIFWVVLNKAKNKLVRLGDVSEVRFGIKTGANEFFFLNEAEVQGWAIEDDFLEVAIKNTRDVSSIFVDPQTLPIRMFLCNKSKEELLGTASIEYIKWGESQGFHLRPSCRNRPRWWDLGNPLAAKINCNYQIGQLQHFYVADEKFYVSNNFLVIHYPSRPFSLAASLNSTWTQLWVSVMGRTNFGGGLLKIETYETADIMALDPSRISNTDAQRIIAKAGMLDMNSPERKMIDSIVFDEIGLTVNERDSVYDAFIAAVKAREERARSV